MPIEDFYNCTCDVLRLTATKDASRGPIAGYDAVFSNVPCRFEDTGQQQTVEANQFVIRAGHTAYLDDPGSPIQNGDVLHETGPTAVSNYYRVVAYKHRRAIGTQNGFYVADTLEFKPL